MPRHPFVDDSAVDNGDGEEEEDENEEEEEEEDAEVEEGDEGQDTVLSHVGHEGT